jgi:hypothetical protein
LNFFVPLLIGAADIQSKIIFNNYENDLKNNINTNCNTNLSRPLAGILNPTKDFPRREDSNLNSYLAGLFEGDGHIVISKGNHYNNEKIAKIRKITIGITFNIKDLPLCEHLKFILGHGWIRIKDKENACVLTFHTDKGILVFVNKINGYLRSPKIYKFNKVIDYLNNKYSLNIIKCSEDYSAIGSNSWLAGFIDADGGFYIRYTETNKLRIACSLNIEQRMIEPTSNLSYEPIFLIISEFLNAKLEISKHNNKSYFFIRASNRNNLQVILNYFYSFNMYSSKYLDYQHWAIVANLLLSNTAYNLKNKKYIYQLKNTMNNKRIYFNWDHLNSLN